MHTNQEEAIWKGDMPKLTRITQSHEHYELMKENDEVPLDSESENNSTPLEINYLVEEPNEEQ